MEYSALGSVVFHPDKPHAAESQRIRTERGARREHTHARIPTQPRRTHRRRPAVPDCFGELPYQPQVGVLLNSPERLRHAEFRLEHQRRAEFVDQSALSWYSELLRKIRAYHSDLFQCDHFALLLDLVHFRKEFRCRNPYRTASHNDYLFHVVGGRNAHPVSFPEFVGGLFDVHVCGFGFLGVNNGDSVLLFNLPVISLYAIGVEHENQIASPESLVVA